MEYVPEELVISAAAAWLIGMPPAIPLFERGRLRKRDEETDTQYEKRLAVFENTINRILKAIEKGAIETKAEVVVKPARRVSYSSYLSRKGRTPSPAFQLGQTAEKRTTFIITSSLRAWAESNGYSLGEDRTNQIDLYRPETWVTGVPRHG